MPIETRLHEYDHGGEVLEGFAAWNPQATGPRPGVAIVHEWWGLRDHVRTRARQLAEAGYVALCLDLYGKGVRPQTAEEAGAQAGRFRNDRPLMRARCQAGVDALRALPGVDGTRIAVIGFCFGGGAAIELARGGSDVCGVVSFHGALDTPLPARAGEVKAKVLILHGADDPLVPQAHVTAAMDELRTAGADWQLVQYGGAVHAFTNPQANDRAAGLCYDPVVERRAFATLHAFLGEIFA